MISIIVVVGTPFIITTIGDIYYNFDTDQTRQETIPYKKNWLKNTKLVLNYFKVRFLFQLNLI
jgi:hypothetical protein